MEQLQTAAFKKTISIMLFQLKFPLFTNNSTQAMFSLKLMPVPFHSFYK